MNTGFVGLGTMGMPMAVNLVKAGIPLRVWNRTPGKAGALLPLHVQVEEKLEDLFDWVDTVVLMLTGPDAIDDVLGLPGTERLERLKNKTLIDMSTISPTYAASLAATLEDHAVAFVDAPVSGSSKPAAEGALVILAGGEDEVINRVQPLFDAMGKHTVRCGPVPQSSVAKLAINLLLGSMMEGFAEMTHFAEKSGLSLETIYEIVSNGPLSNGLFSMKMPKLQQKDYSPQFAVKHIAKDLGFAVEAASNAGAEIPVTQKNRELYQRAMEYEWADEDMCAVLKVLERGEK